jgi:hypothetical protein
MKLWCWERGRQGSGYWKLPLAYSKKFRFDAYILRLPAGTDVPLHSDPSPTGFEHHRINITLRSAKAGGVTYLKSSEGTSDTAARHYHFRPDLIRHSVSLIEQGEVWLLSIGWLRSICRVSR